MDYYEAFDIVDGGGIYASPDFYRMQFADSIAMCLRDEAIKILYDTMRHGTPEALAMLQSAEECGYISLQELEPGVMAYDVNEKRGNAGERATRAHIAMQIAHPALYWNYYGGEHIWTCDHPKMQRLQGLSYQHLTSERGVSDYYADYAAGHNKPKRGRPRSAKTQPKVLDSGHKKWVAACQQYKIDLAKGWEDYRRACSERKAAEPEAKAWLDAEIDKIRQQYEDGMKFLSDKAERLKQAHAELKSRGKPQRSDFE
jgi:hypothetical protein